MAKHYMEQLIDLLLNPKKTSKTEELRIKRYREKKIKTKEKILKLLETKILSFPEIILETKIRSNNKDVLVQICLNKLEEEGKVVKVDSKWQKAR